jgi:hypothetical protein
LFLFFGGGKKKQAKNGFLFVFWRRGEKLDFCLIFEKKSKKKQILLGFLKKMEVFSGNFRVTFKMREILCDQIFRRFLQDFRNSVFLHCLEQNSIFCFIFEKNAAFSLFFYFWLF